MSSILALTNSPACRGLTEAKGREAGVIDGRQEGLHAVRGTLSVAHYMMHPARVDVACDWLHPPREVK